VRVVANHLPDRARKALIELGFAAAHDPTIERLAVIEKLSQVETLSAFGSTLGPSNAAAEYGSRTIGQLPLVDRSAPLKTLGYRILALPVSERADAINLFRAAVEALPLQHRSGELNELYLVSAQGAAALMQVAFPAAARAVSYGVAVDVAARQHGIVNPEQIAVLAANAVLWQPASEVRAGRPADVVAREHGITQLRVRERLEFLAITADVQVAVRQGASADTLARQHGIVTSRGRAQLESFALGEGAAAVAAVWSGEPVGQVLSRHGLILPGSRAALERSAVAGPVDAELRQGRTVLEVASEHDMVTWQALERMEHIYADHHAAPSGEPG
jgi:hypothetical protein